MNNPYKDLNLTVEEDALGEAAKLMTLLNIYQDDEEYEKCAIIKGRMEEVNKILRIVEMKNGRESSNQK